MNLRALNDSSGATVCKRTAHVVFVFVASQCIWMTARRECRALEVIDNGYFTVNISQGNTAMPNSVGAFQAHTGPLHQVGEGRDVNYSSTGGNINIGTSFSGIRIGGENANAYTIDGDGDGMNLDPFFSGEEPTPGHAGAGHRTIWDLFTEQIEIVQDIILVDFGPADSAIYHTVKIVNGRNMPVDVEWLNLLDWATDSDDGLSNTVLRASGPTVVAETPFEFAHQPAENDELVIARAYDAPAGYEVLLGLSYDPGHKVVVDAETLEVTPPDLFQFVQWETAAFPSQLGQPFNVFDYAVDPTKNIADQGRDSASISKFTATIPTAGSVRFTQLIQVRPVPEPSAFLLAIMAIAFVSISRHRPRLRLRLTQPS